MASKLTTEALGRRARARETLVGLYGIADAAASANDPVAMAAALLEGGCRVVQLRCKDWQYDDVLLAARQVRALTRAHGAAFVANDEPELAIAADADGLHLGQLDGPLPLARARLGDRWIGRSTNDLDQLRAAVDEGADYVAFGPVFSTRNISRPKDVQGIERLVRARAQTPADLALVAIGGITPDRLSSVITAGASSWAVIGAIAASDDPVAMTRTLLG